MGICGGAQLLNVICGGTLIQDIKNNLFPINHEQKNPRNETSHKIEIISKTLLAKINKKKFSKVNSAHHQAIKDVGKNIIISSYAPDGIIESIEHKHHKWCIGVQWHPEFLITKEDKNLIKDFIKNTKKIMRIAKYISNAGYCSRREAEKLIDQKKSISITFAAIIQAPLVNEKDKIVIQNQIIKLQKKVRLWKMYKPKKNYLY